MTFLDQPIIYPENPQSSARIALRALVQRSRFARSHNDSLRVAMVGDSTYTTPGGSGDGLAALLPAKVGRVFGNNPGTPCFPFTSVQNGYLWGVSNDRKALVTDPGASYRPPGLLPYGVPFTSGEGSYQPSVWLHKDARASLSQALRVEQVGLIGHENVSVELIGYKQPNSGTEILLQWAPNGGLIGINLFASIVDSEVIEMPDLDGANNGDNPFTARYYSQKRTPETNFSPQWFYQSNTETTAGAGSVEPPALLGYRVLQDNAAGALFDFYGVAGGTVATWIGTPDAGGGSYSNAIAPLLNLGHDIIVLGFGVNDVYAGNTAATVADNYYKPNGAVHKGLIGKMIDEARRIGRQPPLFILSVPPLRVEGTTDATYASDRVQADLLAAAYIEVADRVRANEGEDVIVLNTLRYCWESGFNDDNNEYVGLTNQGAYDTGGVSYVVDDYYTWQGRYYKCTRDHTSSGSTTPDNDAFNNIRHMPTRVHLSDNVHRSIAGAKLEAEAFAHLFAQHFYPATDRPQDDTAARFTNIVPAQFLRS